MRLRYLVDLLGPVLISWCTRLLAFCCHQPLGCCVARAVFSAVFSAVFGAVFSAVFTAVESHERPLLCCCPACSP